jgi:hypothetical protein
MEFVEGTKERLGFKAKGRQVRGDNQSYELREPASTYSLNFTPENDTLKLDNTYFWDIFH